MSLVLNMIGGGGSFTATDAILRVQAPSGSTVTITKGSTTKSDFGHPNINRPTIYDYYFIIHQSQFDSYNPWTITATRDSDTNTTTIIINASDEYDVSISYHVPIDLYQEVEFLQSTGTQGILFSGTYGNGTSFELKVQPTVRPSNGGQFLGFGTGSTARGNHQFDQNWGAYYHSDYQVLLAADALPTTYGIITGTFTSNQFITSLEYNGITGSHTYSYTIPSYNGSTLFYSRNNNGNAERGSSKIFYYKLWKDNVITIEAYPCYRLLDSVAGFYEKVSGTFYINQGSGTFTVGGDI